MWNIYSILHWSVTDYDACVKFQMCNTVLISQYILWEINLLIYFFWNLLCCITGVVWIKHILFFTRFQFNLTDNNFQYGAYWHLPLPGIEVYDLDQGLYGD